MSRTIIISGSNGNLGEEVVNILSGEKHKIIALVGPGDIPETFKKKTLEQTLVDLSNENATDFLIQKMIKEYPELDAAVLLAGGFEMGSIEETNEKLLDQQITLNFKTAWFVIKPLLSYFKKRGKGQFILISARPAIAPNEAKTKVAYAISKSMLLTLAEIINAEGRDSGITASVIIPSILDTPQNRDSMPDADPQRWVKTSDIAKTISFILSDTGKVLRQPVFKLYHHS